ncbi:unnamed protein product, partial [Ectocarpus sp. 12 AP-2014]
IYFPPAFCLERAQTVLSSCYLVTAVHDERQKTDQSRHLVSSRIQSDGPSRGNARQGHGHRRHRDPKLRAGVGGSFAGVGRQQLSLQTPRRSARFPTYVQRLFAGVGLQATTTLTRRGREWGRECHRENPRRFPFGDDARTARQGRPSRHGLLSRSRGGGRGGRGKRTII